MHTGCDKSEQCTDYSSAVGTLISDIVFSLRKYPNHHSELFKKERTPLEEIGFGIVSQTPLDSMHLIDLGVTKKMLIRIVNNKTQEKTPKKYIRNIFWPRIPRSLDDLHHWIATKSHQFLAYTGLIHNKVHQNIFYEFLTLHCVYRLLTTPRHVGENIK